MNPYQRLQPVSDAPSQPEPGLDPMDLMARSFRDEILKERNRARAIEHQANQLRKEFQAKITAYEQKIQELSSSTARIEGSSRDSETRAAGLQAELLNLQKSVAAMKGELDRTRQALLTSQAERDTARTQFRQYHTGHNQAQRELAELRGRNDTMTRQLQETRDLQQNTLRVISTEIQELRRRHETGTTNQELRELIERQILPSFGRVQQEIHASARKSQADTTALDEKLGSKLEGIDRLQTQFADHERMIRKDVQKLKSLISEGITRMSFLDAGSADFTKLNNQVLRIEKSLTANERAMSQISYLLQAVGKQQEQANDLFLNHTEVFLKKQMDGFRGLVAEVISRSQRETQKYIRRCFKDMADGSYEFDDIEGEPAAESPLDPASATTAQHAANFAEAARAIAPVSEARAEGEILAGPPPAPSERLQHLQTLIEKKNDEIRRAEEKLGAAAPSSDAYQKLSLVKELLRTQREHIRSLAEKLARPDAEPERRTPSIEA
ncbi:MAG: hypothetical protein IT285_12285 [Bdellovibrionales bacterium]|nr:hypothetical protein [Bdellovibrionales bacterium]